MQRNDGRECRALFEAAGDGQPPAVTGQNVLDDRQPEAGAVLGAALPGVDAMVRSAAADVRGRYAAAVLDGPAPGRRHRGDRAGRRGGGPARHRQRPARRGAGRPAGDRAGLAAAPATCARTPRPRSGSSPRAVTGPAWPRAAPLSAMPWPRSSRARGPRSPSTAMPGRISTPSWAASASAPPWLLRPAADRQVPSRASSCPDQGPLRLRGAPERISRPVHRRHDHPRDTMSTQPGETPELRSPHAQLQ